MERNQAKEFYPILQAYAEGKAIECRTKPGIISNIVTNEWTEMKEISFWNGIEYRIKLKSKFRPFKNAEECLAEMLNHQPFGWIKYRCAFFHVIYIEDKLIGYGSACGTILHTKFNDALKEFTFADGLPFGVKLDE